MKNDFREFYDKDYILHSMSEEEYIAHGEWANNIRKYIDKVRTRSGKWKYIYPEDLKKKAENVKRDVSYKVRNAVSKVTGKNRKFKRTAGERFYEEAKKEPRSYMNGRWDPNSSKAVNYEAIQRDARYKTLHPTRKTAARGRSEAMDAYQNYNVKAPNGEYYRARQMKQSDYSKKMSEVANKKAQEKAKKHSSIDQKKKIYQKYATLQTAKAKLKSGGRKKHVVSTTPVSVKKRKKQ